MKTKLLAFILIFATIPFISFSQALKDSSFLTLERIFNSGEFRQDYQRPLRWIEDGKAYITFEFTQKGDIEFVKYETQSQKRSIYISSKELTPKNSDHALRIEDFIVSSDGSKVLIFTNSKRVWRSNTKGDYWIFDMNDKSLKQIGKTMPPSSLMFAKISNDKKYVAYVSGFNLYKEDLTTGKITQLTKDGNGDIINGTFDWVYEEEFSCRDGFRWSPSSDAIAFWNLDASNIGTFNMINNTDSIYSKIIPVQYPKVGQDPSACKIGVKKFSDNKTVWIPIKGDPKQNYIPGMQWINDHIILIQQINRKQNHLKIFTYDINNEQLKQIWDEKEKTYVEISHPDLSNGMWNENDLRLVDNNTSLLRTTEKDGWRHVYKVNINNGKSILLTPSDYDVASIAAVSSKYLYFIASPDNSTQRYLYKANLNGKGKPSRVTPENFEGINVYDCSPDGKFAVHTHTSALNPRTSRLITLADHKVIKTLTDNKAFKQKISTIKMPEVEFFTVKTEEGIEIDGRMIKPVGFDKNLKYPVLFHVYGEPWGQVATDSWIGMWNIMLAQKGYFIIDMDNRGTPCLKGSDWRKSIYRKVGVINTKDQAQAAKEILKEDYLDNDRTAVWGWSGGGSMTLSLMFQYPGLYKTGMAVAAVSDQLTYDNIYQERYMGLPQENPEEFAAGSPITHAKNLEGNLLIIHGTADDNVHYQNAEMLINELIKYNKQFSMMAYPNRSHGIYEGRGTRLHLYTLLTNYLMHTIPAN